MCSKNELLFLHVVRSGCGYAMSMFLCDGYDINDGKCREYCGVSRRVVGDVLGDKRSNLFLAMIMKGNGLVCSFLKLVEEWCVYSRKRRRNLFPSFVELYNCRKLWLLFPLLILKI